MARVSLKNVSKTYSGDGGEDVVAVNHMNLEIVDGELVVLVGPGGSGNSTTLRMIAGLEEVSQGEIFIGDKRVNNVAPNDRDIALVFQNDALYPHLSVYDNLALALKLRKFSKPEIKGRVVDAASILGLENLLERKPKALSDDQRARVAIGRAIVRQPKVFLFDEPLANLEAEMRVQMRQEIRKLHQRLQATMIYVTDDPVEAMTTADRIVVMHAGAVQQIDAPLKLYHEPANLFVAGFLGTPPMNLVTGTLKAEAGNIRFYESEGGTIDIVFPAEERPAAKEFVGKQVILGIRPEHLLATRFDRHAGRAAGANTFPALVDMVEPLGAETHLSLQTGAHTLLCRTQAAFDHREAGHRFQFEIDLAKAHLFDPVSTDRLAYASGREADA